MAPRGFDKSSELTLAEVGYLLRAWNNVDSERVDLLKYIVNKLRCNDLETSQSDERDKIIAHTSHMSHVLPATFVSWNYFEKTKHHITRSFMANNNKSIHNFPDEARLKKKELNL